MHRILQELQHKFNTRKFLEERTIPLAKNIKILKKQNKTFNIFSFSYAQFLKTLKKVNTSKSFSFFYFINHYFTSCLQKQQHPIHPSCQHLWSPFWNLLQLVLTKEMKPTSPSLFQFHLPSLPHQASLQQKPRKK